MVQGASGTVVEIVYATKGKDIASAGGALPLWALLHRTARGEEMKNKKKATFVE